MIRILIVDDHPTFFSGLKLVFENSKHPVLVAGMGASLDEALAQVEEFPPDVVLMDIRLGGQDGIEMIPAVRECLPKAKVVMLTASESSQDANEALRRGADGYIVKSADIDDVAAALQMIGSGYAIMPRSALEILLDRPLEVERNLTSFERDVLALVAKGFDNIQIAKHLSMSESTVKRTLHKIEEKLQVENRIQAAVYAATHELT